MSVQIIMMKIKTNQSNVTRSLACIVVLECRKLDVRTSSDSRFCSVNLFSFIGCGKLSTKVVLQNMLAQTEASCCRVKCLSFKSHDYK